MDVFAQLCSRCGLPALMSSTLADMRLSGKKSLMWAPLKKWQNTKIFDRSHLPSPTVVNLQQAFKSHEDWVPVMPPSDGFTDISVDRHEYQVPFVAPSIENSDVVLWWSTHVAHNPTQATQLQLTP